MRWWFLIGMLLLALAACGGEEDEKSTPVANAETVSQAIQKALTGDIQTLMEMTCLPDRPLEQEPIPPQPEGTTNQVTCQQDQDKIICTVVISSPNTAPVTQNLQVYVVNNQICSTPANALTAEQVEQAIFAGIQGEAEPARQITCPEQQPEEGQNIELPVGTELVAIDCTRIGMTMLCDLGLKTNDRQGATQVAFAIIGEKLCGNIPVPTN